MIKKWDVVLLAVLLLLAGILALVFFHGEGTELVVECDGKILMQIPVKEISGTERFTFETKNGSVTVGVSEKGAWIESSDCSNQQCVRSGMISGSGRSIVCLPLHFCIYFTGEGNGEPDGVTG